jgi:hypothetical protein
VWLRRIVARAVLRAEAGGGRERQTPRPHTLYETLSRMPKRPFPLAPCSALSVSLSRYFVDYGFIS